MKTFAIVQKDGRIAEWGFGLSAKKTRIKYALNSKTIYELFTKKDVVVLEKLFLVADTTKESWSHACTGPGDFGMFRVTVTPSDKDTRTLFFEPIIISRTQPQTQSK